MGQPRYLISREIWYFCNLENTTNNLLDNFAVLFLICSMYDFSQKYRGVKHFGLWAEEGADPLGQRDAWAILLDAVKRTYYEDVRSKELIDALDFLESYALRKRPFQEFRMALGISNPPRRLIALRDAADRIAKVLGP